MRSFLASYEFPLKEVPAPIQSVDRWYQLDEASFSLCLLWLEHRAYIGVPDFIVLASPNASNENDQNFVKSGYLSPQKFVHTLPSVRLTALCQLMKWQGPVLCVQKDPNTLSSAMQEANGLLGFKKIIWVMGVEKAAGSRYKAFLYELQAFDN